MHYTGEDYLNALEVADNYNSFIAQLVMQCMGTARIIIDFGAGTGLLAKKISVLSGRTITCLEPAENMKAYLQGEVLDSLEHVADESIDFIYSSNVLEHIQDDGAVITDMLRVLKKGGRVFLYLPAFTCLFSALDRRVGHFRRYNKQGLKVLFENARWNILDLRYADSLGFVATWYYKLFGDKTGGFHIPSLKFYDKVIFPCSRILDKLSCGCLLGKNVYICAEKR